MSQQPSLSSLEALMVSQKSEIEYLRKKLKVANEKLLEVQSSNQSFSGKSTEGKRKVETFYHLSHLSGGGWQGKGESHAFLSLYILKLKSSFLLVSIPHLPVRVYYKT